MIRTEFFDPDRLPHGFFRMTEVGYNRNRELQIHNTKREEIIQSMKLHTLDLVFLKSTPFLILLHNDVSNFWGNAIILQTVYHEKL